MANRTHSQTHTRLYATWRNMKHRCSNKAYIHYGGRGIMVCDEWVESFEAFRNWSLSNGYAETLEIDRIDVNGNYEPGNCRWATKSQQIQNVRKTVGAAASRFKGVSKSRSRWQARIKVDGQAIYLGVFIDEEKAARAYDVAAREHFGEFASVNFKKEGAEF